jgi:hypothetical protein
MQALFRPRFHRVLGVQEWAGCDWFTARLTAAVGPAHESGACLEVRLILAYLFIYLYGSFLFLFPSPSCRSPQNFETNYTFCMKSGHADIFLGVVQTASRYLW